MRKSACGVFILLAAGLMCGLVNAREDQPKKPSDEEITKLLVGKWIIDEGDGKTEPKAKGTVNYKKDGTVELEATVDIGKELKISLSGTWKVSEGVIIATVKKTNVPDIIKEGLVSKDKVISIDDKVLKYKDEMDKEKTHKRAKE
jgi:hypothetical protein